MGIMVGLPSPSGSEKDLQLNFGKNMTVQVEMRAPHLPAEWHMQSGIQLTWHMPVQIGPTCWRKCKSVYQYCQRNSEA